MAIEAEFHSASVERAVVPTLRIFVDLTGDRPMNIRAIVAQALIVTPRGESIRLGEAKCYSLPIPISQTYASKKPAGYVDFHLELDPWRLEKIEQLRGGGDLWLQIRAECSVIDFSKDPPTPLPERFSVAQKPYADRFRIPKADWVEHLLGELGYKKARLLEIPALEAPSELNELVRHIDDAWKHHSTGYYREVLTSCRRGLEAIERSLMNKGFKKTKEVKGEPKPVADWKAFLGGSKVGEYVEEIFEGLKDFTSPGAHAGRDISKPEADYALMCTHGLAAYFLRAMSREG